MQLNSKLVHYRSQNLLRAALLLNQFDLIALRPNLLRRHKALQLKHGLVVEHCDLLHAKSRVASHVFQRLTDPIRLIVLSLGRPEVRASCHFPLDACTKLNL